MQGFLQIAQLAGRLLRLRVLGGVVAGLLARCGDLTQALLFGLRDRLRFQRREPLRIIRDRITLQQLDELRIEARQRHFRFSRRCDQRT